MSGLAAYRLWCLEHEGRVPSGSGYKFLGYHRPFECLHVPPGDLTGGRGEMSGDEGSLSSIALRMSLARAIICLDVEVG